MTHTKDEALKLAQNMDRLKPFVGGLGIAVLRELTQDAFALAAPSQYGSPELQAMVVSRAIEKDRAAQPAPVQEPDHLREFKKDMLRREHATQPAPVAAIPMHRIADV